MKVEYKKGEIGISYEFIIKIDGNTHICSLNLDSDSEDCTIYPYINYKWTEDKEFTLQDGINNILMYLGVPKESRKIWLPIILLDLLTQNKKFKFKTI